MGREIIASRIFTLADQLAFARLSDDHNPMHLDEIAARRTQAGAPVVHGMHAVVWALDALAARQMPFDRIVNLNVRFAKFMYLDNPIDVTLVQQSETALKIELSSQGQATLTLSARLFRENPPAGIAIRRGLGAALSLRRRSAHRHTACRTRPALAARRDDIPRSAFYLHRLRHGSG